MWNCTLKSKVCNPPHSYFCPDRWTASWQRVDFASDRVPSQTWREGTCPPPVSSSKWTRGPGICPCIRRSSDKVCHRRYLRKYNSHSENSFLQMFSLPTFSFPRTSSTLFGPVSKKPSRLPGRTKEIDWYLFFHPHSHRHDICQNIYSSRLWTCYILPESAKFASALKQLPVQDMCSNFLMYRGI